MRDTSKPYYSFENAEDVKDLIDMEKKDLDKLKKEYKNKFVSLKEYCLHIIKTYGNGLNTISWSDKKESCDFGSWLGAEYEYNALKSFVLENADNVKKYRQSKIDSANKAKNEQFSKFDEIKSSGRVYASLVIDASEEYNKNALDKLKKDNNKIAGLKLSYKLDDAKLIRKITLTSPTRSQLGDYMSFLSAESPEKPLTLDQVEKIADGIKKKYSLVDSKEEFETFTLDQVRDAILEYHNRRDKPSQAAYNADVRNATAIKNLQQTFVYSNKGDKIVVTTKTCIEGKNNTNEELKYNDIYQDSITIEYISKELVEQASKAEREKLEDEKRKKQKAAKQLELL